MTELEVYRMGYFAEYLVSCIQCVFIYFVNSDSGYFV